MKKALLTLIILIFTASLGFAQQIEKGNYSYSQNGESLSKRELTKVLKSNDRAYAYYKKARSEKVLANILGFTGGFFVGYSLGPLLNGNDDNYTLTGIGAGLIILAIPLSISANASTKKAIDIYNEDLNATSSHYKFAPKFSIVSNKKGLGLSMIF